jgi:predicted O-methyltransferase YrrM
VASLIGEEDPLLRQVSARCEPLGVHNINAPVGRFLNAVALAAGARRILEIGTGIGYSGIWLARALPTDGRLVTVEVEETRARHARLHFEDAGLTHLVTVINGDARKVVREMAGEFDLVFNDGHKPYYSAIHDDLVRLLRLHGVLLVDNVLWNGEVVPGFAGVPKRPPEKTIAIANYNKQLFGDRRLMTAMVPLRDGLAMSIKLS